MFPFLLYMQVNAGGGQKNCLNFMSFSRQCRRYLQVCIFSLRGFTYALMFIVRIPLVLLIIVLPAILEDALLETTS
jgi:hypothetical protein